MRSELVALIDRLRTLPAGADESKYVIALAAGGKWTQIEVQVGPSYVPLAVRGPDGYRVHQTAGQAADDFLSRIEVQK